VTTLEPGAIEVFTQGLRARPFAAALRATRPAAIITDGLDVLVHEVIDAMDTAPLNSSKERPSAICTGTRLPGSLV